MESQRSTTRIPPGRRRAVTFDSLMLHRGRNILLVARSSFDSLQSITSFGIGYFSASDDNGEIRIGIIIKPDLQNNGAKE